MNCLTDQQMNAYLERVQHFQKVQQDLHSLKELHEKQMATIPFENITHRFSPNKKISIETNDLVKKLVVDHRGGCCFELNALFGSVLKTIGFNVWPCAGRVAMLDPQTNQLQYNSATHMILCVELDGEFYLCDVGFGGTGNFSQPLKLVPNLVAQSPMGEHRLTRGHLSGKGRVDPGWFLEYRKYSSQDWQRIYYFTTSEIQLEDMTRMSFWISYSPLGPFAKKMLAIRSTPTERIIFLDNTLTIKTASEKPVIQYIDRESFATTLSIYFGIHLTPDEDRNDTMVDVHCIPRINNTISSMEPQTIY